MDKIDSLSEFVAKFEDIFKRNDISAPQKFSNIFLGTNYYTGIFDKHIFGSTFTEDKMKKLQKTLYEIHNDTTTKIIPKLKLINEYVNFLEKINEQSNDKNDSQKIINYKLELQKNSLMIEKVLQKLIKEKYDSMNNIYNK